FHRDWSSDVCSSDLIGTGLDGGAAIAPGVLGQSITFNIGGKPTTFVFHDGTEPSTGIGIDISGGKPLEDVLDEMQAALRATGGRSEERRVGKERRAR